MRPTLHTGRIGTLWAAMLASVAICAPSVALSQALEHQRLQDLFGEPVTTSVTGAPQRASEVPAALVIITRDDIRRSPARDIVGLLRAYAGIEVARWTAGQSDVAIRGGLQPFNPRVLVLVNGRQVYLDHYGMTNWASIGVELDEIQQIEVVKGPNSALFGFNAVSGVINIVTVDPLVAQQFTISGDLGTEGYARASAAGAFKLGDNFGVRLSGGYTRWDELDGLERSGVAQDIPLEGDPERLQVTGEVHGQLGPSTRAALGGSYSETRGTELLQILSTSAAYQKMHSMGGRISHDLGWGILSAKAYQNHADIRAPLSLPPGAYHLHNDVTVVSSELLAPLNASNTLRIGAEYRNNSLEQHPGYAGASRYNLFAASGMWETVPTEGLTVTVAGRIDHLELRHDGEVDQPTIFDKTDFTRSITEWSLNSAVNVELDSTTSARVTIGRGMQAPSLFALTSHFTVPTPFLPVVFAGNPLLEPSVIWSGEVGASHALETQQVQLDVNAFFSRTTNIMSTPAGLMPPVAAPPEHPFFFFIFDNVAAFRSYGVDATASHRADSGFSWLLNYNWTNTRQEETGRYRGFQLPIALDQATPEHSARLQLSYERGPWLGTIATRYASPTEQVIAAGYDLVLRRIPESFGVDAKLALKVAPQLTLELSGENLTGAASVDLSPIAAERRLWATARAAF